ncbi:putative E3 ubiquitin-protein ligase SINA-like 9 isoform X2 [Homalodisca vitripennis]|uniref:putative E3 ubiquitin-protein ligase SINA-like 9 isoform X2 n=1 Tax=Homalodisca vitripennis TaxID=197043 RepID=UPI001EEB1C7B|nr:putative E3 ubiquitin-protein ligase SINA-like 9 isoform X2 [Homalodisca vitripennis]
MCPLCCSAILPEEGHEEYCEFRQTECRHSNCKWIGSVKDLLVHYEQKHQILYNFQNPVHLSGCFYVTKTEDSTSEMLLFKNNLFWIIFHRNPTGKFITQKFYYLPTRKPTHLYFFITSFNKGDIEFTSTSMSITDTCADKLALESSEAGVMIPDAMLDRLLEDKLYLNYNIKIVEIEINDSDDS